MASMKPAPLSPDLIGSKEKAGRPPLETPSEAMTFKMSAAFKREFRMAAADRGIRLNQLLVEAFEAWKAQR